MSHDTKVQDRIELQRYFSENGSIRSVPHSNMSASESFTSSTAPPAVVHTDTDEHPNPTYFSIPDAQMQHQQYKAAQPSSTVPSPAQDPSLAGNSIVETQYDIIPDSKHVKGPPYSSGVTMQADNILYEEATSHLQHKTLTMDKQQYKGSVTPDPLEFTKENSGCCGCKKVMLVLLTLVLFLLLVISLVAGLLALAIIFTGFVDICGQCSTAVITPAPVDSGSQASAQMIAELRSIIQGLQTRLEVVEMELQTLQNPTTSSTTPPVVMTTTEAVTTAAPITTVPSVLTTSSSPATMGTIATLREVDLFPNCTTRVEANCTIPPGIGIGRCSTTPALTINNPGEYILNMNCVRAEETANPNPLVAVLDIFDNREATCLCFVPDLDPTGRQNQPAVKCGLRVTRCMNPSNITVTISDEL